jgi:threonine dehydrogenase-like Zn-dependent dehydrogenase
MIGVAGTTALVVADRQMRKRATQRAGEMKGSMNKWGKYMFENAKKKLATQDETSKKIAPKREKKDMSAEAIKNEMNRTIH